jgi:uncharacterized protein YacL
VVIYDPSVIQEVVSQLYNKASRILTTYRILGVIVGLIIGAGIDATLRAITYQGGMPLITMIIGGIVGYVFGNEMGLSKSLLYKFQGQMLLSQVEIVANTDKLIELNNTSGQTLEEVQKLVDTI